MNIVAAAPLAELDGRNLYYTFIAGARKIIQHQAELNKINVFPVNDGDTGTNLASTIRSVIDSIHPDPSYKITADRIAKATLLNARGNSGIIFAQFFHGLSSETGEYRSVTLKQFAETIQRTVRYVYEAVAQPVEGTMLTVIREWADFIYKSRNKFSDFNHLLVSSYEILKNSLLETKSKLLVLAKNDVVDAGAKGFVIFMEGVIDFIKSGNIRELIGLKSEKIVLPDTKELVSENVEYRYCTEAVLKNSRIGNKSLLRILEGFGNSAVVAGSGEIQRFHVHTSEPASLFDEIRKHATITFQKADDMVRQSQTLFNRKWNIALVTDSTCDLDPELFEKYQIHLVPINITFGEHHYLDKITIRPDRFYSLLKESPDYPKSSQINEQTFVNLYSHLATYYDSIISIHLSDKFSGTYNSAAKAAESVSKEFGKPVSVLNSRNISGGLGLVVLRSAQAIEAGLEHDKIVAMAQKWIADIKIYVSVKNIKYLVRGGRVSATKGIIARLLNINPIVSVDETGKAIVFGKSFSQKSNMEKIMKHIKALTAGKKIWNFIVLHAENEKAAEWYAENMEQISGIKPVSVVNISPIIGAHAGIGAASVALLAE